MKRALAAVALAAPLLFASCTRQAAEASVDPSDRTDLSAVVEQIRSATLRFQDVNVALAEGYVPPPDNMCETAEHMGLPAHLGGMGIHYFRPDLLAITGVEPRVNGEGTHTDFMSPAVLIYEPQADGSLELVAVENLVFKAAWEAAGNRRPPTFEGISYDFMWDDPATPTDEAHMFEPHYDLHLWVHRDNPNGLTAQFNPAVSCRHQPDVHNHH
jgi:hypothetical protein